MTNLIEQDVNIFNFEGNNIRSVIINGDPWFVGRDVAGVLGYKNTRDALLTHVDTDDTNTVAIHDGNKGNPNQTIINESGLYSLILSSKLPNSRRFKKWVTGEVLPQIRKTGKYNIKPQFQLPQNYEEALEHLLAKVKENKVLEEKIKQDAPKIVLAEALLESDSGIRITEFARASSDTYGLGRNKMYAKLREWKILDYKNQPYQRCIDSGWFYTVERPFTNGDFSGINIQVFITGKGQKYIINRLIKENIVGEEHGIK